MPEFAWPWVALVLPLPWLLRRWLRPAAAGQALRLPHPGLHLRKLDLQPLHPGVIVLALHLLPVGVGGGHDLVLARLLDGLAHLFRRAFTEIAANRAVKGKLGHGRSSCPAE